MNDSQRTDEDALTVVLSDGFNVVCQVVQHMGNDLVFVAHKMPTEDQRRFYAIRDDLKEWLIEAGATLDRLRSRARC